jgi:molybdopterin-guanine dinucleotide biosynthesis protein A
MMDRAPGHDVVVPVQPEGYQPLHAVYNQSCAAPMKRLMDENRLKIAGFYKGMKVLPIPVETTRAFDPDDRMFINVNSPADLKDMIP